MRKWMGWFAVVIMAITLTMGGVAWAVKPGTLPPSQYPFETTVVTSNTDSVGTFAAGDVIYGFRLIADDAGDTCALLDRATIGTGDQNQTQGTFIDDLVQDTDNRSQDSDWPAPYILQTDLSVATNGACIIYHNPK